MSGPPRRCAHSKLHELGEGECGDAATRLMPRHTDTPTLLPCSCDGDVNRCTRCSDGYFFDPAAAACTPVGGGGRWVAPLAGGMLRCINYVSSIALCHAPLRSACRTARGASPLTPAASAARALSQTLQRRSVSRYAPSSAARSSRTRTCMLQPHSAAAMAQGPAAARSPCCLPHSPSLQTPASHAVCFRLPGMHGTESMLPMRIRLHQRHNRRVPLRRLHRPHVLPVPRRRGPVQWLLRERLCARPRLKALRYVHPA